VVALRFDAELELATLDQALGDLDAAERRLLDALTAAVCIPVAERSVMLLTNALGVTYKFAGRLDDAQCCYDAVFRFIPASPAPDPADLATLFHNFAGLAHSRGDFTNGILWAQRGIDIRSALGDAASLDLARDYGGLGALQHLAGDLTCARECYARAERDLATALGADHHEVAVVIVNRAALEFDTGNPAAARRLYHRAHTSLSAALGSDHHEVHLVEAHLRLLRSPAPS
jgi:tetratricopeptide (TPR) repeat protein